jgi:diguanylate cyclase (GGDEF)-like protein
VVRKHLEALAQRDEMRALAITDPLTGVANRRQLALCGALEVKKAVRHKRPVSVLMVDIDRFKSINDAWGHPTGDRVIQSLARAMVANVRDTDVVGRLGGEEFAVVLPDSEPRGACILAERLRDHVERAAGVLSDGGSRVDFTVSIGVAGLEDGNATFEDILGRADKAMYEAKARGRNTVVCG